MRDYFHPISFTLTDKETGETVSLKRDFNGQIYNTNNDTFTTNQLPNPNHITDKNENCDGERYIDTKYGVRPLDIPVFFHEDNTLGLFELKEWIGDKSQKIFQYEGDPTHKCIDVIYNKELDLETFYGKEFNSKTTISFIAHNPFWYIRNETPLTYRRIEQNKKILIECRGNTDCSPLIKITPNGTQAKIRFMWNDLEIILENVDKPLYLNCEKQRCYEIINNKPEKALFKYKVKNFEYPKLKHKIKNYFTLLEGKLTELYIEPNTKLL